MLLGDNFIKMKTQLEQEQALEWFSNIEGTIKQFEVFQKYFPEVFTRLRREFLRNREIVEIWKKETQEFNPINHSYLLPEQIQLDSEFTGALNELLLSKVNNKTETIEEEACDDVQFSYQTAFELGAKSYAAKNHWFKIFQEEQTIGTREPCKYCNKFHLDYACDEQIESIKQTNL